jgi:cob(I)alamin adenosyltransferase
MSDVERDLQHAQEMKVLQQEQRAERATKTLRGGLLIVLTGSGKGKSSSGFGMVARALGWDMRVGIVQFDLRGQAIRAAVRNVGHDRVVARR